jgi:hypothetical protein
MCQLVSNFIIQFPTLLFSFQLYSPFTEEEEATEYWQDTEDTERSTAASEGE